MQASEARFDPIVFDNRIQSLNTKLNNQQHDFLEGSGDPERYAAESAETQNEWNQVFLNYMFNDEDLNLLKEKVSSYITTSIYGRDVCHKYQSSTALQNGVMVNIIQKTKQSLEISEFTARVSADAITESIIKRAIREDLVDRYNQDKGIK